MGEVRTAIQTAKGEHDWRRTVNEIAILPAMVDERHGMQQHAYADMHLSMILADYWRYAFDTHDTAIRHAAVCGRSPGRWPRSSWRRQVSKALVVVLELTEHRRIRELYGDASFHRVFNDLTTRFYVFGGPNASSPKEFQQQSIDGKLVAPAHVCLAASILRAHC